VARRWFAIAAAARYSLEAARIDDGLISGVTPMLSTRRLAQMQFEVAAERLIDEAISLRQQVGVHPLGSSKVDRGHVAGSIASPMTRVLAPSPGIGIPQLAPPSVLVNTPPPYVAT